jgi:hypothetical protein
VPVACPGCWIPFFSCRAVRVLCAEWCNVILGDMLCPCSCYPFSGHSAGGFACFRFWVRASLPVSSRAAACILCSSALRPPSGGRGCRTKRLRGGARASLWLGANPSLLSFWFVVSHRVLRTHAVGFYPTPSRNEFLLHAALLTSSCDATSATGAICRPHETH